jgi:group I intron endonuclease
MKGYIYITTNLINKKQYIGQSINHKNRNNYLGSGIIFKQAIKKYGKTNFIKNILISNIDTIEQLNLLEKEYIIKFNTLIPNGYNLDYGGNNKGKVSEQTKDKIKKTKSGKKHSIERIEINRLCHLGLKLSEKTKQKIGNKNRGKTAWNKGLKLSNITKQKISISLKNNKNAKKQLVGVLTSEAATPLG